MIYLIGGAPRVGKSIVARLLMKKTGAPWISTDALRAAFASQMGEPYRKEAFPFEEEIDNKKLFEKPMEEVVAMQWKESLSMEKGLEAFVRHHADTKNAIVIEGVHLSVSLVRRLVKDLGSDVIHSLHIVNVNAEDVYSGMQANTSHDDWASSMEEGVKKDIARFSAMISEKISIEAQEHGLPIFQRTNNFHEDVKQILKLL